MALRLSKRLVAACAFRAHIKKLQAHTFPKLDARACIKVQLIALCAIAHMKCLTLYIVTIDKFFC